jgi:hypothetical protein
MNKEEALATIAEMESFLDEFGSPNEEALRTIKRSVFALKCRDGYFNGKLDEFESWAKIGLSTRKFQRWGVERVKHFARSDLTMARQLIRGWPTFPPPSS